MIRPIARLALASAALAAAPTPAVAHLVGVEFGDFYAGALHLALAPENMAALVALGLVAALQPRAAARWMLLGLPVGLAIGVGLAYVAGAAVSEGPIDPAIAVSLAVPGLLGAAALRLPVAALVCLAVGVGLVHGLVNGLSALEATVDWPLFAAGVVSAGTFIGTLAIAVVVALVGTARWAPIADRVVSSWIAAAGAIFLGVSLVQG